MLLCFKPFADKLIHNMIVAYKMLVLKNICYFIQWQAAEKIYQIIKDGGKNMINPAYVYF